MPQYFPRWLKKPYVSAGLPIKTLRWDCVSTELADEILQYPPVVAVGVRGWDVQPE